MRIIHFLKACILLSIPLTITALTHAKQTITLGYTDFKPAYYRNENEQPQGYIIDLAREVITSAGYGIDFKYYPIKRLRQNLVQGDIDLWITVKEGMSVNDVFISPPITTVSFNAYTFDKDLKVTSKEMLKGKKLILLLGYHYAHWIDFIENPENNISVNRLATHTHALEVLKTRGGILLSYERPMNATFSKVGRPKNLYQFPLKTIEVYFIISRKTPNAEAVMENILTHYSKLLSEGKIDCGFYEMSKCIDIPQKNYN